MVVGVRSRRGTVRSQSRERNQDLTEQFTGRMWIPAFAGMTDVTVRSQLPLKHDV